MIEINNVVLPAPPNRVALVHDWLTDYVGGEKVLEQMLAIYPDADIFSSIDIVPESKRAFLGDKKPIITGAQRLPFLRRHYRTYLPLLMFAIEQLDVSQHELVLSSSSAIGKGVLTGPDQLHIAYVHSPMRYAWDMQHQYLRDAGISTGLKGLMARWLLHRSRMWDLRTANGVDHFVANSRYIARRIKKVYRREATVIYPPVDVEQFVMREQKEDFYLIVSRMVPYKKIPQTVEAFKLLPNRRLVVIGDGTEMARVKEVAGSNVELVGFQSTDVVRDYMQRAKAFVFAAEEDFGISPVEAQACGTPVIAFGRGGAVETVRDETSAKPTGVFFPEQTPESIAQGVRDFESHQDLFTAQHCRESASRFSTAIFRTQYFSFVQKCWNEFKSGLHSE